VIGFSAGLRKVGVDVPNVDLTWYEIDDATIGRHLESPLYQVVSADQGVGVSGSIARTIAVPDSGLHHLVALHIARSKWSYHTPCQLRREREPFFVGKAKCYFRVRMNIIASSETIAVRLQKTCMLLPRRCSSAAAARSPV
jgi:hypothetical protein